MQFRGIKPSNLQGIVDHLDHVKYPVTGGKFIEACNNMSDVTKEQKDWVMKNIDVNKTYNSADDIKRVLEL